MQPQTPTLDFDDVNDAFIATPSPSLQSPPPVTNNARKSRLPFLDKATNNRNNGNPKTMANGGVYDPLLPSNNGVTQYGVSSKGSPAVRTPSRRDSGLGKEGYGDRDSEDSEPPLCCC